MSAWPGPCEQSSMGAILYQLHSLLVPFRYERNLDVKDSEPGQQQGAFRSWKACMWALTNCLVEICSFLPEFTKFPLSRLVFTAGPWCLKDTTVLLQVVHPLYILVARLSFPRYTILFGLRYPNSCTQTLGQAKRWPSSHPSSIALTPLSPSQYVSLRWES